MRGILLANLGSPDSPSVSDVRRYLHQFLMDPCVLDIPWLLRKFLVCCTILPRRSHESAHAYASIWTREGSPLILISEMIRKGVAKQLSTPVALGMRYGNPSIRCGLEELLKQKELSEILLVPLYPHYAMSSVETVVLETKKVLQRLSPAIELKIFPPFYDRPEYIEALVARAARHLKWDYDHLLFSYHGLPERHLHKSDPTTQHCLRTADCCDKASPAHATCYRHQVFRTTELFVKHAHIPKEKYSIAFQSRLGKDPWLKPYTDHELVRLAQQGIKKLLVSCPAFVADCLETLEEIGVRARDDFLAAGGEELRFIPCLNNHPRWIDALSSWLNRF